MRQTNFQWEIISVGLGLGKIIFSVLNVLEEILSKSFFWIFHPLKVYSGINQVLCMLEYANHDLTSQPGTIRFGNNFKKQELQMDEKKRQQNYIRETDIYIYI